MQGVTLIPIRKGSKGLKDKAFQYLGQQTLIERTIHQAQQAGLNYKYLVYTDYPMVSFMQPWKFDLVTGFSYGHRRDIPDHQTTEEMLLEYLAKYGKDLDYISFMTVNTPVRKPEWITECLNNFKEGYDSFVAEPFYKQLWNNHSGWHRLSSGIYGPRQTTSPSGYIEHTGVFCIMKPEHVSSTSRVKLPVKPVIVDHPHVGLDIHTQADLDYANWLHDRGEI